MTVIVFDSSSSILIKKSINIFVGRYGGWEKSTLLNKDRFFEDRCFESIKPPPKRG